MRQPAEPVAVERSTDPAVAQRLKEELDRSNLALTGIATWHPFTFVVRDERGALAGGVDGWEWGAACYVATLWVREDRRRRGLGSALLAAVEAEAERLGCERIVLETHSFQAPGFYARLGYVPAGEVAGYPRGHTFALLHKELGAHAQPARARFVIAVTGFVRDRDGRVLLVRVRDRGWELPGGCIESGERLDAGLVREIAEETGCTVAVGRLIGVHSKLDQPQMALLQFACDHLAGNPRPSDETPEVGWFSPAEARKLVTREPHAGRLRDALERAPGAGVVYRTYRSRPFALLDERAV